MKILVIHNHYQQKGGEDTVFDNECAMLRDAGHTVVRFEKDNSAISPSAGTASPVKRFIGKAASSASLFFNTIWSVSAYREISASISREKPDIVHCHNTFPLISPSVYYACAKHRVPVVQTLHNYRMACLNGYLYDERTRCVCEKCLGRLPVPGIAGKCYRGSRSASLAVASMLVFHRLIGTWRTKVTRYIALTEAGKAIFVKAGIPAEKISVKSNAGSAEFPASASRGKDARILYAGRLSPEKGPDVLISAWKLIPKSGAVLEIAGDGPMRGELEASAKGAPNKVVFAGRIPQDELHLKMQSAMALVLPSRLYETFGLSVIEAAAAGTPAVVSDKTVSASIIRPGADGLVFRNGDAADLAAKLSELIADQDKAVRMGDAAREAYLAGDSASAKNLARLLEIYASCLNFSAPLQTHNSPAS